MEKSSQSPQGLSLQRMIEEHRIRLRVEKEEKEKEEERMQVQEKKYPEIADSLEVFYHNLHQKILEAASRGGTHINQNLSGHLELVDMEKFQAFKKIKKFCTENGFKFSLFPGERSEKGPNGGGWISRGEMAHIRITF
ncbi:hypothetical protein EPO14_04100 [Patescibacteria group bacterium]|nr:MAG: hypothetical protein EPO14_04100 [Patescibacteria group bacterium]